MDCSRLLCDFTLCPKGTKLIDFFPELGVFQEFRQQQDENIIKIAILTSDADSPFWKMRGDREVMIRSIFEFLEIGTLNKIGQEFFQKVLTFKHEGVAECWCAYLQMQYHLDFSEWAITKQTYDMLLSESNRARGESEDIVSYANWRMKLRDHLHRLADELKKLDAILFKDSKMARPVAMAEVKKIKNYPEKYATKGSIF